MPTKASTHALGNDFFSLCLEHFFEYALVFVVSQFTEMDSIKIFFYLLGPMILIPENRC